jgi:ATP-dependent protease Clp ATPase subunit
MLDIMFDIPSEDNIREVLITEGVVNDEDDPVVESVRDYGVPG